jgi:folate-binding protein YgfZ
MVQRLTLISADALGVIRIEGDDAQTFLQGQATPDLRKIGPGECVFGAFCNAQGRVIANGWFLGIEGGFRLVISRDLIDTLIKRLKMYLLRAKVSVCDESDLSPLWLIQGSDLDLGDQWMIEGPMGVNLFAAPLESIPAEALILHGEAFRLTLIQASIPLVSKDTSERFIPHMLSMDWLGGLSFDKGCYTGQEIVTRTQFLGKVKRTLHRIATDHVIQPTLGAPIKDATTDEAVGELVAWAYLPGGGATGLAVIKNDLKADIALEIESHPITATSVASA